MNLINFSLFSDLINLSNLAISILILLIESSDIVLALFFKSDT